MDFLNRTTQVLGKKCMEALRTCHIAVFGVGGVGSYTAEALARCGVGHLTLVDNDKIEPSNINRQIHSLHSTIGMYKVKVMSKRLKDINPSITVNSICGYYKEENSDRFFNDYDYVIDAIDSIKSKIHLIAQCTKLDIPIVSSMGTANKLNPEMLQLDDIYNTSVDPIAKIMRKELKKLGVKNLTVVYSKEKPIKQSENILGSVSFVPPVAGFIMAGEVVRQIKIRCNL